MGKHKRNKEVPAGIASGKLALVLAILVIVNLYVFLWRDKTSIPAVAKKAAIGTVDLDSSSPRQLIAEPTQAPKLLLTDGIVENGDSMGRILEREGLSQTEQTALLQGIREHLDFRKIRPGQKYQIGRDESGIAREFTFVVNKLNTVTAVRKGDDWSPQKDTVVPDLEVTELAGKINYSLYRSMQELEEDTSLIPLLVDMFDYDVNFYTDQHPGDEFRIIVEKKLVDGEFLSYGRIIAAEFKGKVGTFRAYSWQVPGQQKYRYFTEDGKSIETNMLRTPLKYTRISSKFNRKRMHPVLHKVRAHWGVDYAAPTGTPIRAAASGKVIKKGWCGGGGNCVKISHAGGLTTVYFHLSKHNKGIKQGGRVSQKEVIGYVGMTGTATGPHLHFEVHKNGKRIDPLRMKMTRAAGIPDKHLATFQEFASPLQAKLSKLEPQN